MWTDIKTRIDEVSDIAKCMEEFTVWIQDILPYGKMKVKIIDKGERYYEGYTDVQIISKRDNHPKGAYSRGSTIEETLENTIREFLRLVEEEYPDKNYRDVLPESAITYMDYTDF